MSPEEEARRDAESKKAKEVALGILNKGLGRHGWSYVGVKPGPAMAVMSYTIKRIKDGRVAEHRVLLADMLSNPLDEIFRDAFKNLDVVLPVLPSLMLGLIDLAKRENALHPVE